MSSYSETSNRWKNPGLVTAKSAFANGMVYVPPATICSAASIWRTGFILRANAKCLWADRFVHQYLNNFRIDAIQQIAPNANRFQADIQCGRNAFFGKSYFRATSSIKCCAIAGM